MIPLTLEVALSTAPEIVLGASSVPFLWAAIASARSSLLMVLSRVDLAASNSAYSLATLAEGLSTRPVSGSTVGVGISFPAAVLTAFSSNAVISAKVRILSSDLSRVRYCSLGVSRENRPPILSASNRSFIEVTNLPKTARMVKAFIGSLACRLFRECSGRLAASLGFDATLAASIAVLVVRAAALMSTTVGSTPLDTAVWIAPEIGSWIATALRLRNAAMLSAVLWKGLRCCGAKAGSMPCWAKALRAAALFPLTATVLIT